MKNETTEKALAKIWALCTELGVPFYGGVGLLKLLWMLAGKSTPRGDIGALPNVAIARELGWDRTPEELIGALLKTRWLDKSDEFRLLVHDWPDHCEDWVHMKLYRAGSTFADGATPRPTRLSKEERERLDPQFKRGRPARPKRAHAVRTASAQEAHDKRTTSAPDALPVRTKPLPLPLPLPEPLAQPEEPAAETAAAAARNSEFDSTETSPSLEPYVRVVELLYPDRPYPDQVRPDLRLVRAELERLAHHLETPYLFGVALMRWRCSKDWAELDGQFIPPADRWIREKRFLQRPLHDGAFGGFDARLYEDLIRRAAELEPQAATA